ncbi:hypothetical protein GXW83_33200 [Streptacidiphilus sp. PB12-B1b]|nr:hypothetical protein GXW83_33200 [Streptacidiphilus sp. PB12-B1b]
MLAFISDGSLPDWSGTEEEINRRGRQLRAISGPVTAEEASALVECFGPDDCYGLAWTLLECWWMIAARVEDWLMRA